MSKTFKLEVELTKEEAMVLAYVIPYVHPTYGVDGDPLKDIYEMEQQYDHEIDDCYKALKQVGDKIFGRLVDGISSLPKNRRHRDNE